MNEVITFSMPFLVALCTFAMYYWTTGKTLTSSQAFPAVALFNVARFPLAILPIGARSVAEAMVGVRRLEKLLLLDEHNEAPELESKRSLEGAKVETAPVLAGAGENAEGTLGTGGTEGVDKTKKLALQMVNATLKWGTQDITAEMNSVRPTKAKRAAMAAAANAEAERAAKEAKGTAPGGGDEDSEKEEMQQLQQSAANEEQERGMLREISVEVYSGELVAIVGAVGAGKSSLLTGALLSQMHLVEGSIEIYDTTMALCEQSAFIFNATLRDNILFGSSYDKPR
jgi:ABC-type multidrug transport system fused ATPase/permease subunit